MKIDIPETTAWTLVVAFICATAYGLATQVVACNTSKAKAEKSCLMAGGSPYKCCSEFRQYQCAHLTVDKNEH